MRASPSPSQNLAPAPSRGLPLARRCGGTTLTIKYLADANCRRWCVAGDEAVFTAAAPVDAFEERPEEEEEEACPP